MRNASTSRLRMLLVVTMVVVSSLTLASFSFKFFTLEKAASRIVELENSLIRIQATLNVDSIRNYKIQKIIAVMNRHNQKLSSDLRYNIASEIYEMSIKYPNLDIELICATITHESAFTWRPSVVSKAGAMGLMQIMPATGEFLAQAEGLPWTNEKDILFNPIYNIRLGSRYLSTLISMYSLDGGLAAYNGGERKASLWLKNGRDNSFLWKETRGYIPAVLKLYEEYKKKS